MILGFGNNVVSSLASDITASQTTFSVIPGDGPLFASLLTSDFSNKSTTLKTYAKITLTDSGETAFEVCHLTAVSGDTLTVIRGQEGTAAKGWALKDVVANFATRGSENAFPQIAHIQSGFYTSGTAGGTANALTLELPTTFFLNGSADWVLKTPIVVYPTQNNTGASTLQLTMGGRVLGTFPLYKGNKAALVANDILKDVALVCLMDSTKTFFNVANPGAIYAGLGTAAFADLVTSKTDYTAGRVLTTGWMSLGGYGTDNLIAAADAKKSLRNGFYAVSNEPTYGNASLISFGYDTGSQVHIIAKQGGQAPLLGVCGSTPQGDFGNWGKIYTEFQKPTALDVGAVPYRGQLGTDDLNTVTGTKYGRFCQGSSANATAARHYPITEAGSLDVHQTFANGAEGCVQEYRTFNSRRIFVRTYNPDGAVWTDWCEYYTTAKKPTAADVGAIPLTGSTSVTGLVRNAAEFQSTSANSFRIAYGGYGAFWRQDGANLYLMLTNKDDPYGSYNSLRPFTINMANGYPTMGRLGLTDWTNFDARYLTLSGGTVTGATNFNSTLNVRAGLELYAPQPFIDFHFGNSSADYTTRLIENTSGNLHLIGSFSASKTITPGNYSNFDARYSLKNTASKTANSMYSKDSSTGVIEVAMSNITVAKNSSASVTFPIAFPTACVSVVIAYDGAERGSNADSSYAVTSYTRTGCVINVYNASGKFMLIAKGY